MIFCIFKVSNSSHVAICYTEASLVDNMLIFVNKIEVSFEKNFIVFKFGHQLMVPLSEIKLSPGLQKFHEIELTFLLVLLVSIFIQLDLVFCKIGQQSNFTIHFGLDSEIGILLPEKLFNFDDLRLHIFLSMVFQIWLFFLKRHENCHIFLQYLFFFILHKNFKWRIFF